MCSVRTNLNKHLVIGIEIIAPFAGSVRKDEYHSNERENTEQ